MGQLGTIKNDPVFGLELLIKDLENKAATTILDPAAAERYEEQLLLAKAVLERVKKLKETIENSTSPVYDVIPETNRQTPIQGGPKEDVVVDQGPSIEDMYGGRISDRTPEDLARIRRQQGPNPLLNTISRNTKPRKAFDPRNLQAPTVPQNKVLIAALRDILKGQQDG